jgi:hypothetical protein
MVLQSSNLSESVQCYSGSTITRNPTFDVIQRQKPCVESSPVKMVKTMMNTNEKYTESVKTTIIIAKTVVIIFVCLFC